MLQVIFETLSLSYPKTPKHPITSNANYGYDDNHIIWIFEPQKTPAHT